MYPMETQNGATSRTAVLIGTVIEVMLGMAIIPAAIRLTALLLVVPTITEVRGCLASQVATGREASMASLGMESRIMALRAVASSTVALVTSSTTEGEIRRTDMNPHIAREI